MKKEDINRSRFCLQYDDHAKVISNVLCSMMEHQSLVDLAIRCGNNTIHVHKCVLAANSNYFKEQLEKNAETEQIIINGLDFSVVKALIEFMYCGETNILEDNMKYFVAASKYFQVRGVQSIAQDTSQFNPDDIQLPAPTFLTKKPKYSNTYLPFNNPNIPNGVDRSLLQPEHPYHRRLKRKFMRTEAEKACAKEAAASRLALEALQKELANTSQVSSFVIEESCTETTVENFIPHTDDSYIENIGHISNVPLQVVNYSDLAPNVLQATNQIIAPKGQMGHFTLANPDQEIVNPTTEKLKHILGTDNLPNNVEIMFKTSEGNFVSVTEEVLANITRGSLQYQLVDENGHASELQEVQVSDKLPLIDNNTNVDSYLVNPNDSLLKKNISSASDAVYIPLDASNEMDQQHKIVTDDYDGMIQECPSEGGYPTEVFVKQTDIKNKLAMAPKEPSFSTKQFEVFEEDNNSVYISNCDPLSEACGIAEKDESEKLKQSEQNKAATTTKNNAEQQEEEGKVHVKKFTLVKSFIEMANDGIEDTKLDDKLNENSAEVDKENMANNFLEGCCDKNKKLIPLRKKSK